MPRSPSTPWEGSRSHGFPRPTRRLILERDPVCTCRGCKHCTPNGCTQPSTEANHITPVAEGGTDHPGNGNGMCAPCHRSETQAQAARGRARNTTQRPTEAHPGLL